MKRKPTFKQAKKRRDAILKKYLKAEQNLSDLHKKLVQAENICLHAATWGDNFKRYLSISCNFSGYED